jgi:hypothetical protein
MRASVNGGSMVDIGDKLDVVVQLSDNETLPETTITITGGVLTVKRSAITVVPASAVVLHMFGGGQDA